MITANLIDQIVDLMVCLNGDEPTSKELDSLNDSSIEELTAKRESLSLQLHF